MPEVPAAPTSSVNLLHAGWGCRKDLAQFGIDELFRPHFLLFALQFVPDAAEIPAELLLEFVHGIGVTLRLCLGDFASEEKFALGFFGFVERVEPGEFGFLFGGGEVGTDRNGAVYSLRLWLFWFAK